MSIDFVRACVTGQLDVVNSLAPHVDIYYKDKYDCDGFLWACMFNHHSVVEALILKHQYVISECVRSEIEKLQQTNRFDIELILLLEKKREFDKALEQKTQLNESVVKPHNSAPTLKI